MMPARTKNAAPAPRLKNRNRGKSGDRGADRKTAKHNGDHRATAPVRGIFRGHGDGVGHYAAKTQAREEAKDREAGGGIGLGRRQSDESVEKCARDNHRLAPKPVGDRSEGQRSQHQAY